MAVRINTNIDAFEAQRNLGLASMDFSKAVQQLSSGLRINSAADDAAGLAISQKLQSQVTGFDQGSRNAQDSISMIQTGESALNTTQSMLQRMRQLSVQASNDTNTTSDRQNIQSEINQLISEIDRIAQQTDFNTKHLLNGSAGGAQTVGGGPDIKGLVAQASVAAGAVGSNTRSATVLGDAPVNPAAPMQGATLKNPVTKSGTLTITDTGTSTVLATVSYNPTTDSLSDVINRFNSTSTLAADGISVAYSSGTDKVTFTSGFKDAISISDSNSTNGVLNATGFTSPVALTATTYTSSTSSAVIGNAATGGTNTSEALDSVAKGGLTTAITENGTLTFTDTATNAVVNVSYTSGQSLSTVVSNINSAVAGAGFGAFTYSSSTGKATFFNASADNISISDSGAVATSSLLNALKLATTLVTTGSASTSTAAIVNTDVNLSGTLGSNGANLATSVTTTAGTITFGSVSVNYTSSDTLSAVINRVNTALQSAGKGELFFNPTNDKATYINLDSSTTSITVTDTTGNLAAALGVASTVAYGHSTTSAAVIGNDPTLSMLSTAFNSTAQANLKTAIVAGGTLTVSDGTKSFSVAYDPTQSLSTIISNFNSAANINVQASYSSGSDELTFSSGDGSAVTISDSGGLLAAANFTLPMTLAAATTNSSTSSAAIGDAASTGVAMFSSNFVTPVTAGSGSFLTVNGVKVTYDASQSLNTVISNVNAAKAGVTMAYDSNTDTVTFANTAPGSSSLTLADNVAVGTETGLLAGLHITGASATGNTSTLTFSNGSSSSQTYTVVSGTNGSNPTASATKSAVESGNGPGGSVFTQTSSVSIQGGLGNATFTAQSGETLEAFFAQVNNSGIGVTMGIDAGTGKVQIVNNNYGIANTSNTSGVTAVSASSATGDFGTSGLAIGFGTATSGNVNAAGSYTAGTGASNAVVDLQAAGGTTVALVGQGQNSDILQGSGSTAGLQLVLQNPGSVSVGDSFTVSQNAALQFHVGANANQTISLNIDAMTSQSLGVTSLDVLTQSDAETAITQVDRAIQQVSAMRGTMGAVINRLTNSMNNDQTSQENALSAQSRIQDVNVAQETVQFTRDQILLQAGTSILAQANQAPTSVLSLLR